MSGGVLVRDADADRYAADVRDTPLVGPARVSVARSPRSRLALLFGEVLLELWEIDGPDEDSRETWSQMRQLAEELADHHGDASLSHCETMGALVAGAAGAAVGATTCHFTGCVWPGASEPSGRSLGRSTTPSAGPVHGARVMHHSSDVTSGGSP